MATNEINENHEIELTKMSYQPSPPSKKGKKNTDHKSKNTKLVTYIRNNLDIKHKKLISIKQSKTKTHSSLGIDVSATHNLGSLQGFVVHGTFPEGDDAGHFWK